MVIGGGEGCLKSARMVLGKWECVYSYLYLHRGFKRRAVDP